MSQKNTSLIEGAKGNRGHDYNNPAERAGSLSRAQNGKGSDHTRIGEAFRASSYWCPICGKGPSACKCDEYTHLGPEFPAKGNPLNLDDKDRRFMGTPPLVPVRREPMPPARRRQSPHNALIMMGAILAAGGLANFNHPPEDPE